MMVRRFVEMCRGGLNVSPDKIRVIVSTGEEGLRCKILVDKARLEEVSEFKYVGCVLNES